MSELRDLYQEVILEHGKSPRNYRKIEDATHEAHGDNPLCGDNITLYLKLQGDTIEDVAFQGSGCAISKASASIMTQALKGKSREDAETLFGKFKKMATRPKGTPFDTEDMGKLAVFGGVCEFPARVKCATLAWHTLHAGLEGDGKASTE